MNKTIDLKSKNKSLSRRSFLGTVGVATTAFTIIPSHVLAGRGYRQPSDTINVAGIGVGAQGGGDIQNICSPDIPIVRPQRSATGQPYTKEQLAVLQQRSASQASSAAGGAQMGSAVNMGEAASGKKINLANIYALCDVDSNFAAYVFKGYPKAKIYGDWREMLEKEKSIDAVTIGTPDHTHAVIASAFIKEKKHVYVQKPMAKTIYECRKLTELAQQYDVITQMGNQGHATEGTRLTVEWIQSGVIGNVREVHLSTPKPVWPQGNLTRPAGVRVPKTLNYDIWLGPAPVKPYHPDILHFNWRGLWDYGTGTMGDMGAHIFDAPIWALNLDYPISIQASSTPYSEEFYPQSQSVIYEFAERYTPGIGYMPPVTVTWSDGGISPRRPKELENGTAIPAALYIGEKGIISHGTHGAMPQLVPSDEDFKGPDPWLPRTGNIFEDWIGAIKEGKKASNDFTISAKLTEIMLLTNLAVQVKRANAILEYDSDNMRMTNLPEADDYFHYEYRQGWSL